MYDRTSRLIAGLTLISGALTAACSDGTGPSGGTAPPSQFGTVLSVGQFDSTLNSGTTRIEIKLLAGGLTAREIHVESDDAEEKIISRVTAIDAVAGTVTLELGGMSVSYAGARLRTPSSSRVSRSAWEAAINSALSAGQKPTVEARRNAPASPQSPTDGSFTPNDFRISDKAEETTIEVYVDSDNFQTVASPPPLAILTVFNLAIQITSSTELSLTTPGGGVPSGVVEFQGTVTSVDVAAGKITLAGGVVVTVGGITFDPLGDLFSLGTTASAVAAGQAVRAEGRGTATSANAITATTIKVEVDD